MNSFHVSSLPTCPYANVYRGRLNHLLMSYPQLSLTITLRNNMVLAAMGFNKYSIPVYMHCVVVFTGLQHESGNNIYIRPLKQVTVLPTATGTHMETH